MHKRVLIKGYMESTSKLKWSRTTNLIAAVPGTHPGGSLNKVANLLPAQPCLSGLSSSNSGTAALIYETLSIFPQKRKLSLDILK